jgi:hypothetical protein
MRACVFKLIGAYLFLFLCLPSHGQISSEASSGHPQEAVEDKDPIAIVEPNLAAEATPIEDWRPGLYGVYGYI